MRDDWDQFAWIAPTEFLPFDEDRDGGASFADLIDALCRQALAEAFTEADREIDRRLLGNGTGEPLGIRAMADLAEPTPAERALAILDPHLRACPLYAAGPPTLYASDWKA